MFNVRILIINLVVVDNEPTIEHWDGKISPLPPAKTAEACFSFFMTLLK
jgi:hypothetical protein